jgi:hypothetical protein
MDAEHKTSDKKDSVAKHADTPSWVGEELRITCPH